jgi:hypothetical protein
LREYRRQHAPSEQATKRVQERLHASIALIAAGHFDTIAQIAENGAPGSAAAPGVVAPTSAASLGSLPSAISSKLAAVGAKWAIAGALGVASVGAIGHALWSDAPVSPPVRPEAMKSPHEVQHVVSPSPKDEQIVSPSPVTEGKIEPDGDINQPALHVRHAEVSPEQLTLESRQISAIDRAIRRGNWQQATRLLSSFRQQFAQPSLKDERDFLEVLVRCQDSTLPSSQRAALARNYLAQHQSADRAERIRLACAGIMGAQGVPK